MYALIDYDVSMMLPSGTDRTKIRLPSRESYIGTWWPPSDTSQGEFDYNPFAYDVGTLGVFFCQYFQVRFNMMCFGEDADRIVEQVYTKDVPILAPFLDRMVTRNVTKRFTAEQALQFFENVVLTEVTEDQLNIPRHRKRRNTAYEFYDRWAGLSDEFKARWAEYREPLGIPFSWKVIRYFLAIEWLPSMMIPNTRLFFFKLSRIPSIFWTHFVGSTQVLRLSKYLK